MVKMSAYFKSVFRSFKKNTGRFVSITVIIFLGIAFVAGLGTLSPQIEDSFSNRMSQQEVADIIVKSTNTLGFNQEEVAAVSRLGSVSAHQAFTAIDMQVSNANTRIYIMPLVGMRVNRLELLEGRLPQNAGEIIAERASDKMKDIAIGDTVSAFGYKMQVVGIVANPLMFQKEGEPDNQQGLLDMIVYFESEYWDQMNLAMTLPLTDIYIKVKNTSDMGLFSDEYKKTVKNCADELSALDGKNVILTLDDNKSYVMLESYCDKISVISFIFPVFFIAVAALVVLTTMTRLIEEERPAIGCYKTLGYGDAKIAFKYVFFSLVCCVLASVLGMTAGAMVLPAVIYPAFTGFFYLPVMSQTLHLLSGFVSAAIMLAAVVGVTLFVIKKELKGQPALLLRPKSPKAGKKTLLEKIPFIWKPLPFRMKSTFRNIFRYVNHFIMTVVSVAGSTALVFAGFSLLDIANVPAAEGEVFFGDLFLPISIVIIIFAVMLCAFVVYNLTNMNIGERKREIATLKVLGYYDIEAAGYIYREIFIMALIGVVLGIPLGFGLVAFVFGYLDFGNINEINWYSYILSGVVVLIFIGIVDMLLTPKIKKIDMTASLKSVE